jgi:hypothetical protein
MKNYYKLILFSKKHNFVKVQNFQKNQIEVYSLICKKKSQVKSSKKKKKKGFLFLFNCHFSSNTKHLPIIHMMSLQTFGLQRRVIQFLN